MISKWDMWNLFFFFFLIEGGEMQLRKERFMKEEKTVIPNENILFDVWNRNIWFWEAIYFNQHAPLYPKGHGVSCEGVLVP